jgi:hypothetical protein
VKKKNRPRPENRKYRQPHPAAHESKVGRFFHVQNAKEENDQMAKTTLERIAEPKTKIEQCENELKRLMKQPKAVERKVRTNRLCR